MYNICAVVNPTYLREIYLGLTKPLTYKSLLFLVLQQDIGISFCGEYIFFCHFYSSECVKSLQAISSIDPNLISTEVLPVFTNILTTGMYIFVSYVHHTYCRHDNVLWVCFNCFHSFCTSQTSFVDCMIYASLLFHTIL